ncbi:unnamed protein product [Miscanthus lutarioriparius]|uniref:Uncharacterized protein n=1 Tax=Miscanthus lutarioriparius TaxID=422564 RepID=A0A811R5X3_9POAL|nr:unnamed protein product [Miscanthus lutarioriparius]
MAILPIKPLDGADGYLRWKESVLLRLHSVGVAHVLSDDAVCRGHILYKLSDRIFPDYVRHGTGRAVWQAVDASFVLYPRQYERFLHRFRFQEKGGRRLVPGAARARGGSGRHNGPSALRLCNG